MLKNLTKDNIQIYRKIVQVFFVALVVLIGVQFTLFVGQLEKDNEQWAIVTSPDSLVHRVKVGNYIGQNFGKITAVTESQLEITELIQDGMGGWIERDAALSLGD